jgi:hypothetical protein
MNIVSNDEEFNHDSMRDVPIQDANRIAKGTAHTGKELQEGYAFYYNLISENDRGATPMTFLEWCQKERGLL